jgi:hypothetical protein
VTLVTATTRSWQCPNLITADTDRRALGAIRFSPSELPGKL